MDGGGGTGSGTGVSGGPSSWDARKDVFRQSYSEVLSALKHQDDKLGRALAAQAFLTAAGITIFTQLGKTSTLTFGSQALTAPRLFFLTFLVSIALALSFTLSAIGPSTPYRTKGPPAGTSLIFYAAIRQDDDWPSYLEGKTEDELVEMLARNYHSETKDLARRVNYKVTRAREAGAFLNLAVTSLAVLGVFSLTDVSASARWWIASGVLLLSTSLPLWDYFHMARLEFPEGAPDKNSYRLLTLSIGITTTSLALAPSRDAQWPALAYALAVVLTSRWGLISGAFARTLLATTAVTGLAILGVVIFLL
jgi:hypothetical protein